MYKSQHKITYGIGNLNGLTFDGYIDKINQICDETVRFMVDLLKQNIDIIPKLSGALRADHEAIFDTSVNNQSYAQINIGSNLPYASRVNQFEDENVQHSIDPNAKGHYQLELKKLVKENIKEIWDQAKMMITGGV